MIYEIAALAGDESLFLMVNDNYGDRCFFVILLSLEIIIRGMILFDLTSKFLSYQALGNIFL